jgi:hypothetical protein
MTDEFGEEHSIYVWPTDHEDGTAYPADFYERIDSALTAAGISWEVV